MAEPVEWSPDGTPRSARFGDVYRSSAGALAQARHVFLHGCGLPQAWAGQAQWRILETGFGLGLNFLAAWRAWKDDPQRPRVLHFASMEAFPVAAGDIVRSAQAAGEDLLPLASELASQWWGLVPGFHRLSFEGGRVLLTLCVGDAKERLAEQSFIADAVFLDGFDPQRNPQMWDLPLLKAMARCCRRGTAVSTWTVAGQVRRDLQQCGFVLEKVPGLPPKRECLRGRFDPAWEIRQSPRGARPAGSAIVIGAGLAGTAAAASLARRGWNVRVLDAASQPAAGASALPAGLLAPHVSPDDNLLSRLSRAGVRITLQEAQRLLREGTDWQRSGVRQRRDAAARPLPDLGPGMDDWHRPADGDGPDIWHTAAAWIRPAALVQAWLAEPGVAWQGGARVISLRMRDGRWQAIDAAGDCVAESDLVVVAAALESGALVTGAPALHPVRGQVSLGPREGLSGLPAHPLNGHGHFVPHVPLEGGAHWLCGSTYVRGDRSLDVRAEEHQANLERLRILWPSAAERLKPRFEAGEVRAWTGVRCASSDRRPLVGEVQPGLWLSTAMGSRGLTFATLAGEVIAAQLHGEPLPLPARLAAALDATRATRG